MPSLVQALRRLCQLWPFHVAPADQDEVDTRHREEIDTDMLRRERLEPRFGPESAGDIREPVWGAGCGVDDCRAADERARRAGVP